VQNYEKMFDVGNLAFHTIFLNLVANIFAMENFDWTKFTVKIPVKATLAAMYEAWAKPLEIEKWFLSHASFTDASQSPANKIAVVEKGFSYAWQWYTYDVTEYGKVTEANGKDFFQFTFAGNCLVDIRLKPYKDEIIVELTQHNIPTDEKSKRDIRIGCHTGWSFFLVNLKSVYEGGLDLRNKDNDLQGMVNS
jgi:hypothetical protein